MLSTQVVANTFLYHAFTENIQITPMKLQKLLYFIFREYTKETGGEYLFSDQFSAWKYGPVLTSIYYEFQSFGSKPIDKFAKDACGNVQIIKINSNETMKRCWDKAWNKYKFCTSSVLSTITCKPYSAWSKAVNKHRATLLIKDIIADDEY